MQSILFSDLFHFTIINHALMFPPPPPPVDYIAIFLEENFSFLKELYASCLKKKKEAEKRIFPTKVT